LTNQKTHSVLYILFEEPSPTHFLPNHYPSSKIHLLPKPTFSLGNIFSLAPSPQGHIYYQGNDVFSLSPPSPQRTYFPQPISFIWPYPLPEPTFSSGTIFSLAPSPWSIPKDMSSPWPHPSPTVLLIKIFTNFHKFLNSLKELMFVVNRGVVLSFPIVDLDQIDDGCEKNMSVGS